MSELTEYAPPKACRPKAYRPSYNSTSTMEDEPLHVASGVQSVDAPQPHESPCLFVFGTRASDAEGLYLHKALWPRFQQIQRETGPGVASVVVVEVSHDQGDFLVRDAAATVRPPHPFWRDVETEPYDPRGVLVIPHKREVIFTKRVKTRTADLPFLKPRFNLDDGPTFESDDE